MTQCDQNYLEERERGRGKEKWKRVLKRRGGLPGTVAMNEVSESLIFFLIKT